MRLLAAVFLVFFTALAPAWAQERLVTLGGDVTEIVFALGHGGKVVATDDSSLHPQAAAGLPKVGYVRRLSAEGVLSVEPDLIVISGAAGPEAALRQLEASGVPIVSLPPTYDAQGIAEKATAIAELLGEEEAGAALRARIEADAARARAAASAAPAAPKILFFAAQEGGAPRAAGRETAADGVIAMLGGQNVFSDHTGYKSLSLEAAVAADPDVILVMDYHADRVGGREGVRTHPALRLTRAAREDMIFAVDRDTVMQFGPRTPGAVADLAERIAASLDG